MEFPNLQIFCQKILKYFKQKENNQQEIIDFEEKLKELQKYPSTLKILKFFKKKNLGYKIFNKISPFSEEIFQKIKNNLENNQLSKEKFKDILIESSQHFEEISVEEMKEKILEEDQKNNLSLHEICYLQIKIEELYKYNDLTSINNDSFEKQIFSDQSDEIQNIDQNQILSIQQNYQDNKNNDCEYIEIFKFEMDSSSEYQMFKLKYIENNAKKLEKFNQNKNLEIKGFYGFAEIINYKVNQFLQRQIPIFTVTKQPKIYYITNGQQVGFVLAIQDDLFHKKMNGNNVFVDFIKILQDICETIEVCLPKDFKINTNDNFFQEGVCIGNTMEEFNDDSSYEIKLKQLNHKTPSYQLQQFENLETEFSLGSKNKLRIQLQYQKQVKEKRVELIFTQGFRLWDKKKKLLNYTEAKEYVLKEKNFFGYYGKKQLIIKFMDYFQPFIQDKFIKSYENWKITFLNKTNKELDKSFKKYIKILCYNVEKYEMCIKPEINYKCNIILDSYQLTFPQDSDGSVNQFKIIKNQNGQYEIKTLLQEQNIEYLQCIQLTQNSGLISLRIQNEDILYSFQITQNNISINKTQSYPSGIQIHCNLQKKLIIIWNNQKQIIEKMEYDDKINFKKQQAIYIYNQPMKSNSYVIKKIHNLLYNDKEQDLYFMNQDNIIFVYHFSIQKFEVLEEQVNTDNGLISKPIKSSSGQCYDEIVYSQNNQYLILRYKDELDFYNINYKKVFTQKHQNISFVQMIKEKQDDILIIENKNKKINCFKFDGGIQTQQYQHKNLEEQIYDIQGNSIIDYFYKAIDKFGNYIPHRQNRVNTLIILSKGRQLNDFIEYVDNFPKNLFELIKKDKKETVDDFDNVLDIIKTRVPLHLASIEMQKLIPLKNGKNNYNQIISTLNKGEEVHKMILKITEQINFGIFEEIILKNNFDDLKVISIMGCQSTGKSYLLNRLFGTRFNVDVNRCTDGLWMGMNFQKIDDKKVCFVVIDCEGLFNIRRTLDEEVRLVLASTSMSDLTIFNTSNNIDDRNFQGFFERLHSISKKLNGEQIFQGQLLMLIRDVENDKTAMQNILNGYKKGLDDIIKQNSEIHGGVFKKISYQGIVNFSLNQQFKNYLSKIKQVYFEKLITKDMWKQNKFHWKGGLNFISNFKTVLSQILIDDDQDMDQAQIKILLDKVFDQLYKSYFEGNKIFDEETSYINVELNNENKKIYQKNINFLSQQQNFDDNEFKRSKELNDSFEQEKIENSENDEEDFEILNEDLRQSMITDNKNEIIQNQNTILNQSINTIQSEEDEQIQKQKKYFNISLNSKQHPMNQSDNFILKDIFIQSFPYQLKIHNQWQKAYVKFCEEIIEQRINITISKFNKEFEKYNDTDNLIEKKITNLKNLIKQSMVNYYFCQRSCRVCRRQCVQIQAHSGDCKCFTNHQCENFCEIQQCQQEQNLCENIYGHQGKHFCNSPNHCCGQICSTKECENICKLTLNHQQNNHDCLQVHICEELCQIPDCQATCQYQKNLNHNKHICYLQSCHFKCNQCNNKCVFKNHQHEIFIQNNDQQLLKYKDSNNVEIELNCHLCDDQHDCKQKCNHKGICEITYERIEKKQTTKLGAELVFDYFKPQKKQYPCQYKLESLKDTHQQDHLCDSKHRCNQQCPECDAFCQEDYLHNGNHHTSNHRNKENNVYLSDNNQKIDYQYNNKIIKFEAGETLIHDQCLDSCKRKGRSHFHFIECPGGNNCYERVSPEFAQHSKQKFQPDETKIFDFLLCSYYFNNVNWDPPVSKEDQKINSLCSFACAHPMHNNSQKESYCTQQAWHSGDHQFTCTPHTDVFEKIQICFIMDNTGSMTSYLQKGKDCINRIISEFVSKFNQKDQLQFAYVGYRDHKGESGDWPQNYPVKYNNFCDGETCKQFLTTIRVGGGGDCEAMIDGFHAMMNLNWIKNSLKFVFHIADQPPHGKKYSNGVSDSYPNGCPCGKTIEPLVQQLNKLEIAYKLCKIGSNLNLYASIMQKEIKNFEQITLQSSVNMDVKVSESLFKDLQVRQYDVRTN